MKHFIIPIFISHKGCKHKCIFCNQFHIAQKPVEPEHIDSIVQSYINSQIKKFGKINPKYKKKQISFYGGSFTCLPEQTIKKYLVAAYKFITSNTIDSLRLSTRPDCIEKNILNILKQFKVDTIEIGAQSLDNKLLKNLKRGHSVEDILYSANLIKEHNFILGLQLMIGVPGETEKIIEKTIEIMANQIKPSFIRIYPLVVLKNTELEKMYYKNEYIPLNFEETIKRAKKIVAACNKNGIKVIRVGLQTTEILKENIVAGVYVENFREFLV